MAWQWMGARSRGSSHEAQGSRLQDASVCFSPPSRPEIFVAIISDGAGSAPFGGEGASLICRNIGGRIRAHFRSTSKPPQEAKLLDWIDDTRDFISAVASRRGRSLTDFAATLVGSITDGLQTTVFHIGDGCIVVRDSLTTDWHAPTWPEGGEFASTTFFLTDENEPKLRFSMTERDIDVIASFSDGLERLALDFKVRTPFRKFFDGISAPLAKAVGTGRDRDLSEKLKAFLGSPQVLERTDDDKSLIVAIRR
jgi:hypothetical protein